MELFPDLSLGLLNGWIVLVLLALTEGICFAVFPKDVVQRLWDRSGWSQKQVIFTVLGKLCALAGLVLLVFTSLKTGSTVSRPVCGRDRGICACRLTGSGLGTVCERSALGTDR